MCEIMTLYSVVRLKISNEHLAVRTTWCEGMQSAQTKNYGNRPSKERMIFYSANVIDAPDFTLPINDEFSAANTGCYKGYVIKTFGKLN